MQLQNKNNQERRRFDVIGAYVWFIATIITATISVAIVALINLYAGS